MLSDATLDTLPIPDVTEAFRLCYQGYVIPIRVTAGQMEARIRAEDIHLNASRLWRHGDEIAAIAMVARRGASARLAAFAVAPGFRGKGVSCLALERMLGESKGRGDERMELEVFEHNAAAVRLYARFGFTRIDRLVGFVRQSLTASDASVELAPATPETLAGAVAADGQADLPWQLQPETLRRLVSPMAVLQDGAGSFAAVDVSHAEAVHLRFLYVAPTERRRGRARALVDSVARQAAGRPIRVPQLVPQRLMRVATRLGFAPTDETQLRMAVTHRG